MNYAGVTFDWLEKGNSIEQFFSLVDSTKKHFTDEGRQREIKRLGLINLSEVVPRATSWLYEPYIALGELTLIEGDPDCGKSWFSFWLGSELSKGKILGEVSKTLLCSCEDSLDTVIASRLDKLGANKDQISALEGAISLSAEGIQRLRDSAALLRPRLLVINPLTAYMNGKDMNSATDIRSVFSELSCLAKEFNMAVVLVRHLKKSQDKGLYRGSGSIDIVGAVRSVLQMGKDPNDEGKGAIFQIKSNLGSKGQALGYAFGKEGFSITGGTDLTSADILHTNIETPDDVSAEEEAKEFLVTILKDGALASRDVLNQANSLSISPRTLSRARSKLKVISERVNNKWVLSLPNKKEERQERQESRTDKLASLAFLAFLNPTSGYEGVV